MSDEAEVLARGTAAQQASARLAREEFACFVEWAWPLVDPDPLVWGDHLTAMCLHLEAVTRGDIRDLLITVPPGHAKSMLVSVLWPAWMWANRPELRIVCSTNAQDLTIRDAVRCRRLVESLEYMRFLADGWRMTSDQNAKFFYENSKGGFRYSTSVGAKTTGHRGHVLIIDDPLAVLDAYSDAKRQVAHDHVTKVLPSRLNNKTRDPRVMICQRTHEEDPAGWAISRGWTHLNLSSEFVPSERCETEIGWADWREEAGELLFPEMFPREVLDDLRIDLGSHDYAAQYLQKPSAPEGEIIKRDWLQRYTRLPEQIDEWMMSWDPKAGSKEKGSSWVVGQVWARAGADCYLVDQVRGRWDIVETLEQVEALTDRWPQVAGKLVENKADGKAIVRLLRERVQGLILADPEGGSKAQRLRSVAPLYEAGNVHHPEEFPSAGRDNTVAIHEHEVTTNNGDGSGYDDQIDAATLLLRRWRATRRGKRRFGQGVRTRNSAGDMSRLRNLTARGRRG